MGKKLIALISLLIIIAFIGYIVYDTVKYEKVSGDVAAVEKVQAVPDNWFIFDSIKIADGRLHAVAVDNDGNIFTGGENFVSCYNQDLSKKWTSGLPAAVTALAVKGDTILVAATEVIYLLNMEGSVLAEWGPFESNSLITSVSEHRNKIAFADAGNKRVFVLNEDGIVIAMIGQSDNNLIIPSPYFDVALTGSGNLYLANTGHRRIEKWSDGGTYISQFGEPGTAPGSFCGCCNPAHFAVIPGGFVTAEKGINRIKILDTEGRFVEFVSSKNSFMPSIPLDVASSDGKTVYGANPRDGMLYVFKRRE